MRRLLLRREKAATSDRDAPPPHSIATSSAPRKTFPCGVKLLYNPEDSAVDIVFIHGLTGDRDKTWTAREASEPWPKTILPSKLPTARILTFGYDAYVADWRGVVSQNQIANHAWNLLTSLATYREDDDTNERPIIFVCHSLGGLVCEDALVTSRQRSERHLQNILRSTRGIAFLGTPHHGAGLARWAELLTRAIGTVKQTNAEIVEVLRRHSEVLARIQDSFHTMVMARRSEGLQPIEISCFYEELPLPVVGLVVPRDSAILPGYIPIGIRGNHMEMTRFVGIDDPGFLAVSGELRRWVKEIGATDKHGKAVSPNKLLGKEEVGSGEDSSTRVSQPKHYAVPLETVHTYTERAELSAELEQKLQIRHERASIPHAVALHGLGGAGKSQLALDYAEKHKGQYSPIVWIDATDEEAVRSSFRRCAAELGLSEEGAEKQESVLADGVVQAVLRWLRGRTEADDQWLAIVDNADDVSWGIQKIMPRGSRGSVIITSQDDRIARLIPKGCESVCVGVMSALEGAALLLQHLQLDAESAPKDIRQNCDKVAQQLGYLALAIDLAGAYISSDSAPEQALSQYLEDYDRHRDELLQMDGFQGLLPTQKTVWTVWDTTIEKIRREHSRLRPELLLTFLAQFKGSIVQDEMFRLASLGMAAVNDTLDDEADEGMPADLRQYFPLDGGKWDSFRYRQSRDVLVRYSLLQRVDGQWPGVTMHSLVQWRAMQNEPDRPWRWWYMAFILAACCRMTSGKEQPEFRRHLMVHLPDAGDDAEGEERRRHAGFVVITLGRVYYDEGRWEEAERLEVEVMETSKTKLGADHSYTLTSMTNLAATYRNQGRWDEAEKLFVEVMETINTKLEANHPATLTSMANLAVTYRSQGRWDEAEKLSVEVMEIRKTKLEADHPSTLAIMGNLAVIYQNQGRWDEAEKLEVEVIETRKIKLGADHPDTLKSMANLAVTYRNQGRWDEAEKLFVEVMETSKTKLGADYPDTLTNMANLAVTYRTQGRWDEAEKLEVEVMETSKTKLGADHPDTLTSMANLAATYWNQGRWDEAEKLEVEVIETRKTKLGADHPSMLASMTNLAVTYQNQGRWNEAEKLEMEVIETSKIKLGADHPDTLTSMANLAVTYRNQGRWDEAEKLQVEVIETRKIKLGADHPDTLTSLANLAVTYSYQGRQEEAERLKIVVIEIRKTKLGADHPHTLTSMANLAATYWNQGRWDEAEKLEVEVMEIRKTKFGADHPDTLTSMANLAFTWRSQGRHADALALMESCVQARQRVLGERHPDTITSVSAIESWR